MKHFTKVITINVSAKELQSIRDLYNSLIADTDFQKIVDAINVLYPDKFGTTVEELIEKIDKAYSEVIRSLGPVNANGSLDIDVNNTHFETSSAALPLILTLYVYPECWRWTLHLFVDTLFDIPGKTEMIRIK